MYFDLFAPSSQLQLFSFWKTKYRKILGKYPWYSSYKSTQIFIVPFFNLVIIVIEFTGIKGGTFKVAEQRV